MNKLFTLTCIALTCACSQPETIDYTVFTGSIENANADSIVIYGSNEYRAAIALNEMGSFRDTLRIENGYFTFRVGSERSAFYLQQGKELNLNMNAEEFDESIQYTGSGANESNFLADSYRLLEEHKGSIKAYYSLTEKQFADTLAKLNDSLKAMVQSSKANKNFKEEQSLEADFRYSLELERYPNYHRHYAENPGYNPSPDFKNYKKTYTTTDEISYKRSGVYRDLVALVFSTKINDMMDSETSYDQALQKAAESWERGYIKNELLNDMAMFMIGPNENLEKNYEFFKNSVTDSAYQEEYALQYERMKKLSKGMPSPTFSRYENHAGDSTSFDELKGKYTYFDVWATWCGPCIREIPSLKEVEKQYHDKDIQFVSVSIDRMKDHDTWVEMVNEKELGGMQLMADRAWQSDFVQNYEIKGIPRFILVDPMGNIVTADAPRPSNPELTELFDELGI